MFSGEEEEEEEEEELGTALHFESRTNDNTNRMNLCCIEFKIRKNIGFCALLEMIFEGA